MIPSLPGARMSKFGLETPQGRPDAEEEQAQKKEQSNDDGKGEYSSPRLSSPSRSSVKDGSPCVAGPGSCSVGSEEVDEFAWLGFGGCVFSGWHFRWLEDANSTVDADDAP